MLKIDKCWYKRKGISQSTDYGSYSSPKIYTFDSYLDNNENNYDIFDITIIMKRNRVVYLMRIW